MSKVWFLPLEPLEERYTAQMKKWVCAGLSEVGCDFEVIESDSSVGKIRVGEWLDVFDTSVWKANQISRLTELIRCGGIKDGDVILLGDVWMPGIEILSFIRELSGINLKVAGWHYAGCFDRHDMLAKKLTRWGAAFERMLFDGVLTHVCYGSAFHKSFVTKAVGSSRSRYDIDLGLAWDPDDVRACIDHKHKKKNQVVVFPHRPSDEKRWWSFVEVAKRLHGSWKFVASTNSDRSFDCPPFIQVVRHKSKTEYYRFLESCGVMYSSADQETFGYAYHESIALGVPVVVPSRCCYAEPLNGIIEGNDKSMWLYDDSDPIGEKTLSAMMDNPVALPMACTDRYSKSHVRFIRRVLNENLHTED